MNLARLSGSWRRMWGNIILTYSLLQVLGSADVWTDLGDVWTDLGDVWTDLGGVAEDGWSGNLIADSFVLDTSCLVRPVHFYQASIPFKSKFITNVAYTNLK
ncbi:hypothetical protein GIB67_032276 [Kingdonia uniflora]|uniref:Uncharacterized protein n=1 Tax=Kingdonia uniflora TaxID=39325 RepID=A0A7J7MX54_9MAGN|nr:hypothetical protein GIB67_032276 [Kingdonia uniflora]